MVRILLASAARLRQAPTPSPNAMVGVARWPLPGPTRLQMVWSGPQGMVNRHSQQQLFIKIAQENDLELTRPITPQGSGPPDSSFSVKFHCIFVIFEEICAFAFFSETAWHFRGSWASIAPRIGHGERGAPAARRAHRAARKRKEESARP